MAETNVNDIITIDIVNGIIINTLEDFSQELLYSVIPNKLYYISSYRIDSKPFNTDNKNYSDSQFIHDIAKYLYPKYTNEFDNDILLNKQYNQLYRKNEIDLEHYKYDNDLKFFIGISACNREIKLSQLKRIVNKLGVKVFLINFKKKENTNNNVNIKQQIINEYQNNKDKYDEEEKTISENPTKYPYNRILYGAPRTGKSYQITEDIKEFIPNYSDIDNNNNRVFRTTLHPEYSYYDFVGSIKPKTDGDKITYEFNKGIFTKALIEAYENEEENLPIFLVLEEMSRANVSAVFGDIFQLLDRKNGFSEYKIKNDDILKAVREEYEDFSLNEIYIPNNLFIWGTLNTSDQNVFVMDNAFKRRFEFEYIAIKPPVKKENSEEYKNDYYFYYSKDKKISWCDFYQKLDKYITEQLKLSEDKQLGQFYIKFTEDKEMNNKQIVNKLMNYLWNDVQNATLMNDTNKIFNKNIKSFYDIIDICSKILKNESNIELFDDTFIKCLELKLENNE